MRRPICPDCQGALSAGLLYGLEDEPTDCLICWECGYQVPPVYVRSRSERNEYAARFDGECRGCGGTTTARGPHLLRALCDDCYATRRVADRTTAIRGGGLMVAARHEITQSIVWLARTPGCGDLCSDRYGHHAETHEVYGAVQERERASSRKSITTGVLTVDLAQATVSVAGRRVQLTARMWQVLEQLALHVGECVRYDDIIRAVWGADWLHTPAAATHNVNITLHRLRSVFGAAAPLLVTRVGVGVVLLNLPPGDMSGVANERQAASQRWARYYDHCRGCGRDDRAHDGHGYCYLCRRRVRGGRPL